MVHDCGGTGSRVLDFSFHCHPATVYPPISSLVLQEELQYTSCPPCQHDKTCSKIVEMEENRTLYGKRARITQLDGADDSDEDEERPSKFPKVEALEVKEEAAEMNEGASEVKEEASCLKEEASELKEETSEVQEEAPTVPDRRISHQIQRICNHILENPLTNNTGLLQVSRQFPSRPGRVMVLVCVCLFVSPPRSLDL